MWVTISADLVDVADDRERRAAGRCRARARTERADRVERRPRRERARRLAPHGGRRLLVAGRAGRGEQLVRAVGESAIAGG